MPIVDIFSELQLTDDTDKFRGLLLRFVMERKITIRVKITYRFVVAEARIVFKVATDPKRVPSRMEAFYLTDLAPEGADGVSAFRRRRVLDQRRLFECRLVCDTCVLTLRSLHKCRKGRAYLVYFG